MQKKISDREYVIPDLGRIEAVSILVFFSLLTVFLLVIFDTGYEQFDWTLMSLASLFVIWVVLASAAVLQSLRRWLMPLPQNLAIAISYLTVLLVLFVLSLCGDWVIRQWSGDLDSLSHAINWNWIIKNQLVGAIITGVVMRFFVLRQQLREKEHAELNARMDALQSRIRPHFLFNSMNVIANLIPEKPDLAEKVVEDMSELFRANLMESRRLVKLNEELELCRRYLDIESIRLGKRLTIEWQLDLIPDNVEIPLLTLQPLLENAVFHGIQPLLNGGTILIQLHHKKPFVNIVIKNPVPEVNANFPKKMASSGHQMALENIQHRLAAVYGESAILTNGMENQLYVVRLQFPDGS